MNFRTKFALCAIGILLPQQAYGITLFGKKTPKQEAKSESKNLGDNPKPTAADVTHFITTFANNYLNDLKNAPQKMSISNLQHALEDFSKALAGKKGVFGCNKLVDKNSFAAEGLKIVPELKTTIIKLTRVASAMTKDRALFAKKFKDEKTEGAEAEKRHLLLDLSFKLLTTLQSRIPQKKYATDHAELREAIDAARSQRDGLTKSVTDLKSLKTEAQVLQHLKLMNAALKKTGTINKVSLTSDYIDEVNHALNAGNGVFAFEIKNQVKVFSGKHPMVLAQLLQFAEQVKNFMKELSFAQIKIDPRYYEMRNNPEMLTDIHASMKKKVERFFSTLQDRLHDLPDELAKVQAFALELKIFLKKPEPKKPVKKESVKKEPAKKIEEPAKTKSLKAFLEEPDEEKPKSTTFEPNLATAPRTDEEMVKYLETALDKCFNNPPAKNKNAFIEGVMDDLLDALKGTKGIFKINALGAFATTNTERDLYLKSFAQGIFGAAQSMTENEAFRAKTISLLKTLKDRYKKNENIQMQMVEFMKELQAPAPKQVIERRPSLQRAPSKLEKQPSKRALKEEAEDVTPENVSPKGAAAAYLEMMAAQEKEEPAQKPALQKQPSKKELQEAPAPKEKPFKIERQASQKKLIFNANLSAMKDHKEAAVVQYLKRVMDECLPSNADNKATVLSFVVDDLKTALKGGKDTFKFNSKTGKFAAASPKRDYYLNEISKGTFAFAQEHEELMEKAIDLSVLVKKRTAK